MREGSSREFATKHHLKYAEPLVADGVTWRWGYAEDTPPVVQLVRKHIAGMADYAAEDENSLMIAARDKSEAVIGGGVMMLVRFKGLGTVMLLRLLVVEPEWRGRGVGVVTLGTLTQAAIEHAGQAPDLSLGNCSEDDAGFYQRAGFSVLEPGQDLPFPVAGGALLRLRSDSYPCWMCRPW
ncbi:MAG TPA: GNAT family N-acetyltransferase [Solirubrobacteraceae bacterium]